MVSRRRNKDRKQAKNGKYQYQPIAAWVGRKKNPQVAGLEMAVICFTGAPAIPTMSMFWPSGPMLELTTGNEGV